MKPTQRIDLISKISRELQSRYTFEDIDAFLSAYKIKHPTGSGYNSKWVYAKEALGSISDQLLVELAAELNVDVSKAESRIIIPPKMWEKNKNFKLFISHLAIHKDKATKLKDALKEIGFSLGRNIKIISLRMDEDPKGFISKHQAILRRGRNASGVAEEINTILINDFMTKDRMNEVRSIYQTKEDDEIPF